MKNISSLAELEKEIEAAARRVMDGASEDILERFKAEYVTKFAYAKGNPHKYPRSFDFREAWIWSNIKKSAKTLSM